MSAEPPSARSIDDAPVLALLARELREEQSVISPLVRDPAPADGILGTLVAVGPRTIAAGAEQTYAAVIESVREGYLLHYGSSRLLADPDPDLALLAGDYLYAKALERLAALGDLAAIRELGDLISLSAQLHAAEEGPRIDPSLDALWLASTVAIGAGGSDQHELGKATLRRSGAAQPLYAAAIKSAAAAAMDEQLAEAAEAVGFHPSNLG